MCVLPGVSITAAHVCVLPGISMCVLHGSHGSVLADRVCSPGHHCPPTAGSVPPARCSFQQRDVSGLHEPDQHDVLWRHHARSCGRAL